MPSIADHWVRLSDRDLAVIIDGPPDQDEGEPDVSYIARLYAHANRVADLVEDGLETW